MIFGINTTSDISKLSQISLTERLVKFRITILKYHSWYLCQISLQIMLLPILMSRNYRCVKFVNISKSSLGVFSDECSTFLDMMNDTGIDKKQQLYIIKKMINIVIRATYYIFCCRNRNWDSPDLMQFWFSFLFFLF